MFSNVTIDRFRGINHAEITGFKRVNLFCGRNNCGKSTVLESLFLLTGQSLPYNPIRVNRYRLYESVEESDLSLLFYNLNTSLPIHLATKNGEQRELSISLIRKDEISLDLESGLGGVSSDHKPKGQYGLKMDYSKDGRDFHSSILLSHDASGVDPRRASQVQIDPDYEEQIVATFLPSRYEFLAIINMLERIIEGKNEESLFEALRIFDPRVVDFVISSKNVWVDIGLEKRIPINMMGDGMRQVLAVIVSLIDSKDGILLVDEIDNGLSFRVFKAFWQAVFKLAQKFNVQVFATTHNLDSMQGFSDALEAMKEDGDIYREARGFSLTHGRESDCIEAYAIDPEQFAYALEKRLELR